MSGYANALINLNKASINYLLYSTPTKSAQCIDEYADASERRESPSSNDFVEYYSEEAELIRQLELNNARFGFDSVACSAPRARASLQDSFDPVVVIDETGEMDLEDIRALAYPDKV